eukprot:1158137-Pelagomonas_calceolata.AAC.13
METPWRLCVVPHKPTLCVVPHKHAFKAMKSPLAVSMKLVMKSPPAGVKLVMRAVCIMLGRVPDALKGGRAKDADAVVQVQPNHKDVKGPEVTRQPAVLRSNIASSFTGTSQWGAKGDSGPSVAGVCFVVKYFTRVLLQSHGQGRTGCSHRIQQFVHDPAFNPSMVSRSSRSAAVLGKWVIAIDAYQHVKKVGWRLRRHMHAHVCSCTSTCTCTHMYACPYTSLLTRTQIVDPKRQALRQAEEELKAQEARLKEAQEHLATINAKIQV